jgi:hypothetical protein
MRIHALGLPLLLLVAVGCVPEVQVDGKACDGEHPCIDGFACVEGICIDEGIAGILRPDAGQPSVDSGGPEADGGGPPVDAGVPSDAGGGELDAGMDPETDGGGGPGGDAGDPGTDGGGGDLDAGPAGDAGVADECPVHLPAGCVSGACQLFKVGPFPDACDGACDFSLADETPPIAAALQAAQAGDTIRLYSDGGVPAVYDEGGLEVGVPVTLEGAPGQRPTDVVITHGEETPQGVVHLTVDGVTLRNFAVRVEFDGTAGVSAVIADDVFNDLQGVSRGHLIESLDIESTAVALGGVNGVTGPLFVGGDTLVRNNLVRGWFESGVVARLADDDGAPLVVVHNTLIPTEPADLLRATGEGDVVIEANISAPLNERFNASVLAGPLSGEVTWRHNVLWRTPVSAVGTSVTSEGNVAVTPRFLDARSPILDQSSVLKDSVPKVTCAPDEDALGVARSWPTAPGAVSRAGAGRLPVILDVGRDDDACLDATGSPCDFSGPDALAELLPRALPNSIIHLHGSAGSPAVFEMDGVIIDHPVRLLGPADEAPGSVILTHGTSPAESPVVVVTQADNVMLVGLRIDCAQSCDTAVWVDRAAQMGWPAAALNLLIDRCEAVANASQLQVNGAFTLGHSTTLRNSVARGMWEALAKVESNDASIIGNTFFTTEPVSSVSGLWLGGSARALVANNLFDFTSAVSGVETAPLRLMDTNPAGNSTPPTELSVRHNQFYGVDVVVSGSGLTFDIAAEGNCVTGAVNGSIDQDDQCATSLPGFSSSDPTNPNLRVKLGSEPVGAGDDAHAVPQNSDFGGRPRIVDTVDVGAWERQPGDP